MDAKASLTRKVGPLPMWAWALMVGGGIGFYLRHRAAVKASTTDGAATTPANTADVNSPLNDGYASGIPGDYAGYGGAYAGTSSSDLIGAVEQGIGQYLADNPPAVTQPSAADATAPSPQDPFPIAITVGGAPSELKGGGPPKAPAKRSQVAPSHPKPPAGKSPDRANSGTVRGGVDIGTLDAAMAITGQKGYPRVQRDTMAARMRAHPNWGPYTLAHNGQVKGHSTAF